MRAWVVARKELKSYFTGPAYYVITGLFLFIVGYMFTAIFNAFVARSLMMSMSGGGKGMSLNDFVFSPHLNNTNVILLILVPAMTMWLIAEEYRARTFDLLMTSPITAFDIIFGKFIACAIAVWTMIGIMAIYPIAVAMFSDFDKAGVLSGFLGLMLISGIYVAVGIFASSITENVIIAYFLALVINLFLWVVGWAGVGMEGATAQSVFNYLSIVQHFGDFTKGIISSSATIYYLSLMFFFCFLAHRVVESARWR